MWEPISLDDLNKEILSGEKILNTELRNFWNLVKVKPVKWQEREYGDEGGGFWVVAICRSYVVWYNDIEDGFNVSRYENEGQIGDYWCNQDELEYAIANLFTAVLTGDGNKLNRGEPLGL